MRPEQPTTRKLKHPLPETRLQNPSPRPRARRHSLVPFGTRPFPPSQDLIKAPESYRQSTLTNLTNPINSLINQKTVRPPVFYEEIPRKRLCLPGGLLEGRKRGRSAAPSQHGLSIRRLWLKGGGCMTLFLAVRFRGYVAQGAAATQTLDIQTVQSKAVQSTKAEPQACFEVAWHLSRFVCTPIPRSVAPCLAKCPRVRSKTPYKLEVASWVNVQRLGF